MLVCRFKVKERKRNAEIRELIGLELVSSVVVRKGRLRWLGHADIKIITIG